MIYEGYDMGRITGYRVGGKGEVYDAGGFFGRIYGEDVSDMRYRLYV